MIDEKIKNISDKEKLEYLEELLENDMDFKVQFINYFNLKEKVKNTYEANDLKSLVNEIYNVFDNVDTEIYVEALGCGHEHYYGYYEEDISNELCESLFLEVEKRINHYLKEKDFYKALFVLFAIGKAIDLSPNIDDQYGLIYDYEEILSDYNYSLISKFVDVLQKSNLSFEDIKRLLIFLLNNSESVIELKRFELIFDCLISSKEIASFLSDRILEFDINIQLKILNFLDDDTLYIISAKKFYKEDLTIAKKLLKKLDELSLYEEYETIAKECFYENKNYFASDIFEVIKYEKSKEFYLEILRYKVLNNTNLDEYILYKKYLDPKELEYLHNEICKGFHKDYCIKVLSYEKRHDTILKLAKENLHDLDKYVKPIKFYFPNECLELVIEECNSLLNSYNRSRKSYIRMCELLQIMKDIESIKTKMDSYIKILINIKPSLPALKDELSKVGLI